MANGKRQTKNYKNVEIMWPKTTWRKIVGGPSWDGEKYQKVAGEYTGSAPAFSATRHAAQKEVQVASMYT